jgi:uncharacterized protein YcbX
VHVSELWRYPVKSMRGVSVPGIDLDETGVVDDRRWAVRDLERGGIRGAKKIPGLMRLGAREVNGARGDVAIELPDGSTVTVSDPEVHRRVSDAVGRPVRLEGLRPADDLDHYRRGPADTDDVVAELMQIFGRVEGEPLPDFGVFPPEVIEFESPPGTYYDCYPLLVLTTSALRSLTDALPDAVVDVRRFRPSIVIDTGDEPGHPELGWAGRRFRVGAAEIEIIAGCPRCVMITHEVAPDVPADRSVLRHVVRELGQDLGAYARVTVPGAVSVGDVVQSVG